MSDGSRHAAIAAKSFHELARAAAGHELHRIVGLVSKRGWEPDWALGFSFEGDRGIAAATLRGDDWCFATDPEGIRPAPDDGYSWESVADLLGLGGVVGQPLEGHDLRWEAAHPEPEARFVLRFPLAEVVLFNAGDELGVHLVQREGDSTVGL